MAQVFVPRARFAQPDCVPPDPFWNANRAFAELAWQQGDGGTTSTRIAEDIHAATGIPERNVKTNLHAVAAAGVGVLTLVAISRLTDEPALRLLGLIGAAYAARRTFKYLQQDRCRQRQR